MVIYIYMQGMFFAGDTLKYIAPFFHFVPETVSVGSPWYSSIWSSRERAHTIPPTDRTVKADQPDTSLAQAKGEFEGFVDELMMFMYI